MLSMFGLVFLGLAVAIGGGVFRVGVGAGWHWGKALAAAAVPVAFTFFLGFIGLLIGAAFLVAVWKAAG